LTNKYSRGSAINLTHLASNILGRDKTKVLYNETDIYDLILDKLRRPELKAAFLFALIEHFYKQMLSKSRYLTELARNLWKLGDEASSPDRKYDIYLGAIKCYLLVENKNQIRIELNSLMETFKSIINEVRKKTITLQEAENNKTHGSSNLITTKQKIHEIIQSMNLKNIYDYMVNKKTLSEKFALDSYFKEQTELEDTMSVYAKWPFSLAHGLFLLLHSDDLED
jgi:hypothetical protein